MNDLADPVAKDPPLDSNGPGPTRPPRRHHRALVTVAAVALLLLAGGGGVWWHDQVTADPGLEFQGANVSRDEAGADHHGIDRKEKRFGFDDELDEVHVAFETDGRLYAHLGLYNGGAHHVRITAAPKGRFFYWGSDGLSVSADPDDRYVGVARHYQPFRPFTLHRGETVNVRLEYRQAGCDPSDLQPNGYSRFTSLLLRYRTLGITRRVDVPFRDAAIALDASGDCSRPIIGH
jgi:hypothetical protein